MSGTSVIQDGRGGKTAEVDDDNRLSVKAVTVDEKTAKSSSGDSYIITSAIVELTNDLESALLYIKNNEDVDWIISSTSVEFGATDGTGDMLINFTLGATGGTIIDNAVPANVSNLNLGSAKPLGAIAVRGVEGDTLTGGGGGDSLVSEGTKNKVLPTSPIILAPGTSIGVGITPSAGNTSMKVIIGLLIYRNDT